MLGPQRVEGFAYRIGPGIEKVIAEINAGERQRIGQDLHDGLGQLLTGIAFLTKIQQEQLAEKSLPEAAASARIVALGNEGTQTPTETPQRPLPSDSDPVGLPS